MAGKRHENIIQRKEISMKHVCWSKKYFLALLLFVYIQSVSQTENVECHINMTSKSRGISITAFG